MREATAVPKALPTVEKRHSQGLIVAALQRQEALAFSLVCHAPRPLAAAAAGARSRFSAASVCIPNATRAVCGHRYARWPDLSLSAVWCSGARLACCAMTTGTECVAAWGVLPCHATKGLLSARSTRGWESIDWATAKSFRKKQIPFHQRYSPEHPPPPPTLLCTGGCCCVHPWNTFGDLLPLACTPQDGCPWLLFSRPRFEPSLFRPAVSSFDSSFPLFSFLF